MKKLVTVFVFVTLASLSWAQTTGVAHLMPNHPVYQHSVFVNPPKYVKPFKPLSQDDIGYIDLDAPAFVDLAMPSRIDLGGNDPRSDTLVGYGVHFTSPYSTRAYLDSVTIMFVVANVSPTMTEEQNYLKIKVMESVGNYIFYPNNGDTVWFPVPNHAVRSSTRAKDSLVIKNLSDYLPDDPDNPEYKVVTFKMNHKPVTSVANPEFYIEFLSAYDTENFDAENQNVVFVRGDDWEFPEGPYDFNTQRTVGIPKTVEYSDQKDGVAWWQDLIPYAGITNNDHPSPGFYSNAFIIAHVTDQQAGVEDIKLEGNALAQNYPNPFNPSTQIAYSVKSSGDVTLKVFNALGEEVKTLVNGFTTAGKHEVTFDASELPTGTYYYTIKSGDFTSTKRMVLAK